MHQHSHFGVYAFIQEENQLLLIEKSRGPYTGLYDLPGGSLEEGELLEEALRREIKEETGCAVESLTQLKALDAIFPYYSPLHGNAQLRHIGVIYSAHIHGSPRTEPDNHDSNGCGWHNVESILLNPHKYTPFVVQAVKLSVE